MNCHSHRSRTHGKLKEKGNEGKIEVREKGERENKRVPAIYTAVVHNER